MEIDNTQERNEPLAENPEEVQPSSNTSDNVQIEKWLVPFLQVFDNY